MDFIKVAILQDNDQHWYVVPYELVEEFERLQDEEDSELEFIAKFSAYKTGGSQNAVQLYIKLP